MTKKKATTAKKEDSLVKGMDAFAAKLIEDNNKDSIPIAVRLDVFKALAQWVGIKNRINAAGDEPEGGGLNEYRDRLSASREAPKRAGDQSVAGRAGATARWGTRYDDADGGSALDAIKNRVPEPSAVGADGGGGGS